MKKKLLLLSSFLFVLATTGCSCSRNLPDIIREDEKEDIDDPIIDDGYDGPGFSAYADEDGNLTDEGWAKMIKDSYKFCEEEVEQGSVLLFNREVDGKKALPLTDDERNVSLFGQGTRKMFMRSGAGGAAPNDEWVVTLEKAFETNGFKINKTLLNQYQTGSVTNPNQNVEANPSVYTDEVKATFDQYNDAAIITIVRVGTENTDPSKGALKLTENEKSMIELVKDSGKFKKIILLINSPMPMSMDFVDTEYDDCHFDAAIWMGVPGYYGSGGVVHLLMGKDADGKPLSPSGHLSETFVDDVDCAPAAVNFGNSNIAVYQEGIYVGYKYYETRYEDLAFGRANANSIKGVSTSNGSGWNYAEEVKFPFGYGESYVTFDSKITGVMYNTGTDQYEISISVKNEGRIDAKYTGQVYVQQPYTDFDKANGLEKSAIILGGYEKVDVKAGKTVEFNVNVDRYFLTTYDNVVNKTYILEGGDYYFAIGNGAHEALNNIISVKSPTTPLIDHDGFDVTGDANCVAKVTIEEDKETYSKSRVDSSVNVTNQFDDADYNYYAEKNGRSKITYLSRQDWFTTWPTQITTSPAVSQDKDMSKLYSTKEENKGYEAADGVEYDAPAIINGENRPIEFAEMGVVPLNGKVTYEDSRFKGMEGADVWDMFIKQLSLDDLTVPVSDNRGILAINRIRFQGTSISEGAEGLLSKFKYGDMRWATGFATGPNYTSTWDHNMQKKFGGFYAEEALFCGVSCVNGPGVNIVRTAYTSRASEYMSEDAVLNYYCAANIISEARRKGLVMNVKHAFLNNQETGRQGLETYCNEQAIREIYLKPFEGAVVKGGALGVETSYNRIGTTYAATHNALMNNVMRGEWGFKGMIADSALTGSNSSNYANGPAMLHNGTDVFILDGGRGQQLATYIRNNDDLVLLKDLQRANKNIFYALSRSSLGGWSRPRENSGNSGSNQGGSTNQGGNTQTGWSPITNEVKAKANQVNYDFDPSQHIIVKEEYYDYQNSELNTLNDTSTRDGHYLVYYFEGSYSEGYQGQYNEYYAHIYLWDDGLMFGKSHNQTFKGYWYNDSDGDGKVDCLNMVSNSEKYSSIICTKTTGFYDHEGYIFLHPGWGDGRSIIVSGYQYYPEVDIAIKLPKDSEGGTYSVGDYLSPSSISVYKILKNLKYGIVSAEDVNVTVPSNMLDSNGNIKAAGTYTITATYKNFTATRTITVAA